jgi:hypothetical protein
MKGAGVTVVLAFVVARAGAASAQANLGGAPGSCDSGCLTAIADAYFAALVAHDPSRAALAPGAKSTENTQPVAVGKGLWKTATEAPTSFEISTVFGPDGAPTPRDMTRTNPFDFESVRIFKIRRGQIHEIEAMGISLPFRSLNGWSPFWR